MSENQEKLKVVRPIKKYLFKKVFRNKVNGISKNIVNESDETQISQSTEEINEDSKIIIQ